MAGAAGGGGTTGRCGLCFFYFSVMFVVRQFRRTALFNGFQNSLPCVHFGARQSFAMCDDEKRTAKCLYRAICCRVPFAVHFIAFIVRCRRPAIPLLVYRYK
jgi:hypothetical protein